MRFCEMTDKAKRLRLFDIEVDNLTRLEAIEKISDFLNTRDFHHIITINASDIYSITKDEEVRQIHKEANLVFADGISIVWTSWLLGRPIKQKVSGADLLPHIMNLATQKGYKVFILKMSKGAVDFEIEQRLLKKFPGILIVGMCFPTHDFDIETDSQENDKILKGIQGASPDILIVSLGSPKGKRWIWRNRKYLKDIPICAEFGAAINYTTNILRRAPRWMQTIGLEWFFRFCCEPHRLWKRCLLGNTFFLWVLLKGFFSTAKRKIYNYR